MFKNILMKTGAFALVASTFAVAVPADAHRSKYRHKHQATRYYDNGYNNPYKAQRYRNNYYQQCDKGRGGAAIGAVAGGLAGHEIARRGDRTLGTIIGAGIGALAGHTIDKADDPCRRR